MMLTIERIVEKYPALGIVLNYAPEVVFVALAIVEFVGGSH